MDSKKDKQPFILWSRLTKSFVYAWHGIKKAWKYEQNFRIHSVVTALVFIFAQVLNVPLTEQAILAVMAGGVLALELINTAIERTVDLMVQQYDTRAKVIKDTAAGAVFVFSLAAALVGVLIFLPKIIALF
ncbi:diacylglycerol kinase family protein [Evansella clarkii]|uniref:diacylglycerol kinase family protein n=1 Tax=Evansella clarkii TaxID=79879 RepID=UPI000B433C3F|nr:diacylglycerol kinase family protein [Evansella clarkii]